MPCGSWQAISGEKGEKGDGGAISETAAGGAPRPGGREWKAGAGDAVDSEDGRDACSAGEPITGEPAHGAEVGAKSGEDRRAQATREMSGPGGSGSANCDGVPSLRDDAVMGDSGGLSVAEVEELRGTLTGAGLGLRCFSPLVSFDLSSERPCANWHLWWYGHLPLDAKLTQRTVRYRTGSLIRGRSCAACLPSSGAERTERECSCPRGASPLAIRVVLEFALPTIPTTKDTSGRPSTRRRQLLEFCFLVHKKASSSVGREKTSVGRNHYGTTMEPIVDAGLAR